MKGRPSVSEIRKKISSILNHTQTSYGYDIYKKYKQVFGKVELRTVYYNLKKGVLTKEFIIHDIRREIGNYTWGNETERIYYANGPYASPFKLDNSAQIKIKRLVVGKYIENTSEQIIETKDLLKQDVNSFIINYKKIRAQIREKQKNMFLEKIKKLKKYVLETPNEKKQNKIDEINQIRDILENI